VTGLNRGLSPTFVLKIQKTAQSSHAIVRALDEFCPKISTWTDLSELFWQKMSFSDQTDSVGGHLFFVSYHNFIV